MGYRCQFSFIQSGAIFIGLYPFIIVQLSDGPFPFIGLMNLIELSLNNLIAVGWFGSRVFAHII